MVRQPREHPSFGNYSVLQNIQILRAVAAVCVVLFHATGSEYGAGAILFSPMTPFGASGVDLFFVVSGFIMVYSLRRHPVGAGRFLLNRAVRIAPLYWTVTLGWLAFWFAVSPGYAGSSFSLTLIVSSLSFTAQIVGFHEPIIFTGWSLEYEVLFYLVLALGLVISSRNYIWVAAGLVAALTLVPGVSPIALEFLFGMIVAKVYRRSEVARLAPAILGLGVIVWLASATMHVEGLQHFPGGWERVVLWGIPSTLIVTGAAAARQVDFRPLIVVGDASYSIYLIHPILLTLITYVGHRIKPPSGDLFVFIATVACIAAGVAFYRIVERPLTRLAGTTVARVRGAANRTKRVSEG